MNRTFTIWLLYMITVCTLSSWARTATVAYTHRLYTVKDGLPDILVTSLFQDNQGYLWVGTKSALARFDGKNFTVYNANDGLTRGINTISQLPDERILVCTNEGIQYVSDNNVSELYTDSNYSFYFAGGVLIGSTYYLCAQYSDPAKRDLQRGQVLLAFNTTNNAFRPIKFIPEGCQSIFSISNDTALVFSYDTQHSISYYHVLTHDSLYPAKRLPFLLHFTSIKTHRSNNVCMDKKGNCYIVKSKNHEVEFLWQGKVNTIAHGLFLFYTPKDKTIYYRDAQYNLIQQQENKSEVLWRTDVLWCGLVDSYGNTWFATEDGLLCFYNFAFKKYNWNFDRGKKDNVWSQAQTSDSLLWLNNYSDGLYSYNIRKNEFHPSATQGFQQHKNFNLYFHPVVRSDTLYYPTSNSIVAIKNDRIISYTHMPTSCLFLFDDSTHNRVLAGGWGIFSIDRNLKVAEYKSATELKTESAFILCMARDNSDRLWYVTSRHTGYVDSDGQCYNVPTPQNTSFTSVICDSKGTVWLAGSTGLWYYSGQQFHRINNPQIAHITGLYEYHGNKLILSGNGQVHIMDLDSFYMGNILVTTYTPNNGYTGENGSQNSISEDMDGYVWINARDAVYRFHPDLLPPVDIPVPYLQSVEHSADLENWETASGNFTLRRPGSHARFMYTAPSLNFSGTIYYQYRIGGLTDWSEPTEETYFNYTHLPAGKYVFELRSSLDALHWSNPVRSGVITVKEAWYESVFFYLSIILLLMLLVTVIILVRVNRNKEKYRRIALMAQLALLSLRNKLLPHFTSNVQGEIIAMIRKQEYDNAILYTKKLAKLNRKIIDAAGCQSHSLKTELELLEEYLNLLQICYREKLQYSIELGTSVDVSVAVPAMSLQLFAENAIKHGLFHDEKAGRIDAVVSDRDNGVEITITDNGIGRERASRMNMDSVRSGLRTFADTIAIYNLANKNHITLNITDLYDERQQATGTKVTLFIPYEFKYS